MIAAVLAILSYLPFKYVAKGSLVICVLLFVLDPIPPVSRLLALIATGVVGVLSKAHREWQEAQSRNEDDRLEDEPTDGGGHDFVLVDKVEQEQEEEKDQSPTEKKDN